MEFIELLTKVWMESEKRKQDREEWDRTMETRRWAQNTTTMRREVGGVTRPRSPCPASGTETSGIESDGGSQAMTDTSADLSTILRHMAESFGSLSTNHDLNKKPWGEIHEAGEAFPPKYCDYQDFAPPPSSQTDLKQPISRDTNDVDDTAPCRSYESNSNTPLKVNFGEECSSQGEVMTSEEKTELLDIIKKLSEEQQALKTKITEHDERLLTLMTKKPSIRRRMTTFQSKQLVQNLFPFPMDAIASTARASLNANAMDENTIEAQIEQLYANLCRIHFPLQQKTVTQCLSMNETQIYSSPSSSEMAMNQENMELREKIKALENSLRRNSPAIREAVQGKTTTTNCNNNNNDMESLKFSTDDSGNRSSLGYTNLPSPLVDTTDENVFGVWNRDIQHVSSTFEWSITNYSKKLSNEKLGKVTSTVSEPFYIGHCGYLARLEVYLNGCSSGWNKCMSAYLRVIKGDYDNLQRWPAQMNLSFVLVDQSDAPKGSLIYSDGQKVFQYKQPSGDSFETSDAWGLVEFVCHGDIHERQLIKNDVIRLKVVITTQC